MNLNLFLILNLINIIQMIFKYAMNNILASNELKKII